MSDKPSRNNRSTGKPAGSRRGKPPHSKDGKMKNYSGGGRGGRNANKPSGGGWKGRSDQGGKSAPRKPRVDLTNAQRARKAAAMAVTDVLGRGFRLEGSLAKNPAIDGLDPRDRAFARAIAATTLRRLGQIDAVLDPLVQRSPPGKVRAYLQTATAQMVFMDVAPHAAVGDTVTLMKADFKAEPFSGLANAVLRKVAETGKSDAAKTPPVQNIPAWLRRGWEKRFGKAAVRRMALLLATSPPLDLSVKADPVGWAERLGGIVIGGTTVRLDTIGNVAALLGYETGDWWAQDVAAALPARLLSQAMGNLSGKKVADLCAAPGGKTLQLISMGADVTAIDLSEARIKRLSDNLSRTGLTATVLAADITEYDPESMFDAVLLDAPCSATGTFRRHPDVLYNRKERDITPLTRLQDKLLKHAAKLVSPGGVLVYSVCSLQDREGGDRVRKFLKSSPDFSHFDVTGIPDLEQSSDHIQRGMVNILPTDAPDGRGMDGFFIAVLKRSANTEGSDRKKS